MFCTRLQTKNMGLSKHGAIAQSVMRSRGFLVTFKKDMCGQALKITSLGGCDWVSSHSNIRSYIFQPPQSGRKPMVRCNAKLEKNSVDPFGGVVCPWWSRNYPREVWQVVLVISHSLDTSLGGRTSGPCNISLPWHVRRWKYLWGAGKKYWEILILSPRNLKKCPWQAKRYNRSQNTFWMPLNKTFGWRGSDRNGHRPRPG